MTTDTENQRRVREAIEALNDGDPARFAEYHAADVAFHEGSEDHVGRDAVETHAEQMIEAFPDLEFTVEEMIAEGDSVAFRYTLTGTQEREFDGVPASGETFGVGGLALVELAEGQATEVWVQDDQLGMQEQLGAGGAPVG